MPVAWRNEKIRADVENLRSCVAYRDRPAFRTGVAESFEEVQVNETRAILQDLARYLGTRSRFI